jgi:hypothetical protein
MIRKRKRIKRVCGTKPVLVQDKTPSPRKRKSVFRVSDHAFMRYFERVMGFDLEMIKQEILSAPILGFIQVLGGSGSFPNDGYNVVLKDNTVVSIIAQKGQ